MKRTILALLALLATMIVGPSSAQATPLPSWSYGYQFSGTTYHFPGVFKLENTAGGVDTYLTLQGSDCNLVEYTNRGGTNHAVWASGFFPGEVCNGGTGTTVELATGYDGNVTLWQFTGGVRGTLYWQTGYKGPTQADNAGYQADVAYYMLTPGYCYPADRYTEIAVFTNGGYSSTNYPFGLAGC